MITRNPISSSVCLQVRKKPQILDETVSGRSARARVAGNLSVGTNRLHERQTSGRVSCILSRKSGQRQNCQFAVKSTAEFRAGFEIILTKIVSYQPEIIRVKGPGVQGRKRFFYWAVSGSNG